MEKCAHAYWGFSTHLPVMLSLEGTAEDKPFKRGERIMFAHGGTGRAIDVDQVMKEVLLPWGSQRGDWEEGIGGLGASLLWSDPQPQVSVTELWHHAMSGSGSSSYNVLVAHQAIALHRVKTVYQWPP